MTFITRRAFIKRTGSASLGTALGLGLIPSVTTKLKAADTSGGIKGVRATTTSAGITASAAPLAFGGGTVHAGVSFTYLYAAGSCNAQLVVKWRRWFSYSRSGAVVFTEQQLWQTSWICSGGSVSSSTQYLNEDGSLPAPGTTANTMTLESRPITDAKGKVVGLLEQLASPGAGPTAQGVKAAVTDGFNPISSIIDTGLVSHSVSCCTLVAV